MPDPINLRRARKQRARDEKRKQGDVNATAHGRSKAEREGSAKLTNLAARRLDGIKRERPEDG
ncbi:MAG: DUF4169 family protein [Pseudomonadota bacterium]